MTRSKKILGLTAVVLGALLGHLAASGKFLSLLQAREGPTHPAQAAGTAGSPVSTTTIDGKTLPPPPPKFAGVIKENAAQSRPWWPPRVVPPAGAPNVLLIMTDDVGFGAPSTFGGVIPTPALDRIASMGLRYTNFHSCALCSPTRAALITGRNHHSVGFGQIAELATGYPGYNSLIGPDATSIGTVLRDNGYGTSWFGKEHNIPTYATTSAGPFDQWPAALGFEYFYGFPGGDTSQWQPNLYRNTTRIYPYADKPGWNLTTAMADEAIDWLNDLNELAPDKPFFCYYVPGGTHAPHHATPEWIKKISDLHLFDKGWNELREQIFANQKKLGVIPPDARLTPWPTNILRRWDALGDAEKKLFIRQADVYAAFLAYTDHEIGRVIQAVADIGKLDNTLIIYISGDNGSSAEGSPTGTPNEMAQFNGVRFPVERQLKEYYDAWGSDKTYNHMAVGWTWAFDTPFKWTKQIASHFGGTRQGMCMAWPKRIKDAGGIRPQFHHVIDVAPTILEATGIPAPDTVNGVAQKPIEGVSMAYTWDKTATDVPSRHTTQYFEMFGNRAIYHDGWVACTTPIQAPWILAADPPSDTANAFKWELYDITKDWTEHNDLAETNLEKLKELQTLFATEAARYHVLPLDSSKISRLLATRPRLTDGRTVFTYTRPVTGIPYGGAPSIIDRSYTITAEVEIPQGGAEGVLNTNGGRFGGYGLYLLKGKPVFTYNVVDFERYRWESREALTTGKHAVEFDFTYHGPGLGKGGTGVLKVDGKEVASKTIPRTLPVTFQWDESFDVGSDTGTPVDDADYQVPFRFTGKLNTLTVTVGPIQMNLAERKNLQDKAGQRD
jgi:arylsulfatase A-like enzyme